MRFKTCHICGKVIAADQCCCVDCATATAGNSQFSELQKTRMPFGDHIGKTFDDIPLPYLDWLVGQVWLKADLKARIETYLAHPLIAKQLEKDLEK